MIPTNHNLHNSAELCEGSFIEPLFTVNLALAGNKYLKFLNS